MKLKPFKLKVKATKQPIFAMGNVAGNYCKEPHKLDFSFYFSKQNSSHSIRVKVSFNPESYNNSEAGVLKMHGDWEFKPGPNDKSVSGRKIAEMKDFFQKYKVLFAAVWNDLISENDLHRYFKGKLSYEQMITKSQIPKEFKPILLSCGNDMDKVTKAVEDYDMWNMWN